MEKHRIRISKGNRKMGGVPSVSLPPIITCNPDAPCTRPQPDAAGDTRAPCYVVRNMLGGPQGAVIGRAYAANLALLKFSRAEFFRQLSAYLARRGPAYFRFHVSGDFVDSDHLCRAFVTAAAFPAVRFLAFSKRFSLFPRPSVVPVNFSLIASLWPGWGKRPHGYRVAFMQDGTERRVPRTAIECPGNCEACGMCWALPRLRADVVFPKH